jgi:hypothetical protein|tara:strand:- start:1817 stop:1966 length:150 start_codon:yes stop_codon:yes gene_type:complete
MEIKKESPWKKMPADKPLKRPVGGKSSNLSIKNKFKTPRGFGNSKTTLK